MNDIGPFNRVLPEVVATARQRNEELGAERQAALDQALQENPALAITIDAIELTAGSMGVGHDSLLSLLTSPSPYFHLDDEHVSPLAWIQAGHDPSAVLDFVLKNGGSDSETYF